MRQLEKVFKACADKNRLRILKLLEQRKLCVCEIAFVIGITQPSVSKHVKKLRDAGLIQSEQDSFWTNHFIGTNNAYARAITALMRRWITDDAIIQHDRARLKQAQRQKLCCAK